VRTRYGTPHSLWRAVGQDGDTLDILGQSRHDRTAATRCFRELLKGLCSGPCVIIIDTLKRDEAATPDILPGIEYRQQQGLTNQDELLHQPTRQKERQVRSCNPLIVMHRQWLYVPGVGLLPV
jgi:putative transposase